MLLENSISLYIELIDGVDFWDKILLDSLPSIFVYVNDVQSVQNSVCRLHLPSAEARRKNSRNSSTSTRLSRQNGFAHMSRLVNGTELVYRFPFDREPRQRKKL